MTVLGGLVALIIIGSIASAAMGSGGSSGNATACSDYWSIKNNIGSDPATAATGWHNLQAIASEITNSGLATAVGAFNEAMNNNDTTGASTASIAIGTACTSLGYNNPG